MAGGTEMVFPRNGVKSEQHLETECDLTLAVSFLGGDRSERRVHRVRVRYVELDVIQGVEALEAKLRLDALLNGNVLEQGEIEVVNSVGANSIEAAAEKLDIVRQNLRGEAIEARIRVEPALGAALGDWKLDVMNIAIEDLVEQMLSFMRQHATARIAA